MKSTSLTFKVAILAIGKTVKRLIGTISILILVRMLSQDDFGTYKQVLLIIGLIVAITEFSIPKSLLYFVPAAKSRYERENYLSQSFIFLTIVGVFSALLLFAYSASIADQFNNPAIEKLLKVFAPSVIFMLISQNFFSYLLISLDKHKSASYSYVFVGLPKAISVIVAVMLGLPLIHIFSISLGVMAVQYVVLIVLIKKQGVPLLRLPKIDLLREQWIYVLPLSLSLLSGIVTVQLDKLVISYYFTPAVFAIYSVGAMQVPFVANLFEGVSAAIIPKIVQFMRAGDTKSVEELSGKGTRKVSLLIFPIFVFLFIYAEQLITLLYTYQYVEAVPIFRIYLFVVLMKISLCGNIIIGSGRTGIILKTSLFILLLNVILNFVLVKYIGMIGPAIATVGARLLQQTLFAIWVKRILDLSLLKIFPFKILLRIFFISIISGLVVYPILFAGFHYIISIPLTGIMYLVVYLFLLDRSHTLLDEERDMIKVFASKILPIAR